MQRSVMVGCLAAVLMAASAKAEGQDGDKGPSFWMKQKLTYAQGILNGLAAEDYDLINENATAMKGLNKLEYFVRQKPAAYRTQLKTFQFSVDALLRNSEDQNLDGATLAFTQMTVSCVNCHKEIRRQQLRHEDCND